MKMIDDDNWINRKLCLPIPREEILVKYANGETEFTFLSQNTSGRIYQGFMYWKPLAWINL